MSRMKGITAVDAVDITKELIFEGFAANRSEASIQWWNRSRRFINDAETGDAEVVSHFAVKDLKRRLDMLASMVPVARPRVARIRERIATAEEIGRFLCHQ